MKIHRFNLVHDTSLTSGAAFDDPVYDAIKADPPQGCSPEYFMPWFGLSCAREADSKWDAVVDLIAEIRSRFGMVFNDLGVDKMTEWYGVEDPDGFGPELVAHLLAMASERAGLLGLRTDDLIRFLRVVDPDNGRSTD